MLIPLGFLAASSAAAVASFDLLETTVLTGSQASVEFTNLTTKYASTYQHLQVRMVVRTNRASDNEFVGLQFNSDTTSSYRWHFMEGNESSVSSADSGSSTYIGNYGATANNSATGAFGAIIWDLLDPFETTKNKTIKAFGGRNSVAGIQLHSGAWFKTDSVTSAKFYLPLGNSFVAGTRVSLYGLKAA